MNAPKRSRRAGPEVSYAGRTVTLWCARTEPGLHRHHVNSWEYAQELLSLRKRQQRLMQGYAVVHVMQTGWAGRRHFGKRRGAVMSLLAILDILAPWLS